MEPPFSADEICADWLAAVLAEQRHIESAESVKSITVQPTRKAGLTSVTTQIAIEYTSDAVSGPRSLIAKLPSPDPSWRKFTSSAGVFEREARFYTELRPRFPLRTPECFYALVDYETDRFALLLEELQDVVSVDEEEGATLDQAMLALSGLARVHAEFWNDPALGPAEYLFPIVAPDRVRYQKSFARVSTVFAESFTDVGHEIGRRFGDDPSGLYNVLAQDPVTLVHNDFRLDNLFFGAVQDLAVIDFQAIAANSPGIDLAMFICLSFTPESRRRVERELLDVYADQLRQSGVVIPQAAVNEAYRHGLLYLWPRIVLPLGSAAEPIDPRFARLAAGMIDRTQAAVDDHACLDLLVP
jgi:AcrR family transcriptional regulator